MLMSKTFTLSFALLLLYCSCSGGGSGQEVPGGQQPAAEECGQAPLDTAFDYFLPSEIPAAPSSTIKTLVFGITPQDWWGKSHNQEFTCYEDNKPYVESMAARAGSIGSTLFMFQDAYVLNSDLSMSPQPFEGAMTATPTELTDLVTRAKAHGATHTILLTGLYSGSSNAALTSYVASLHLRGNRTDINTLFDNWKTLITTQAQRAYAAGFDGLVLDPRDIYFFFPVSDSSAGDYDPAHDDVNIQKWKEIITAVRVHFPNPRKLYFWGGRGFLSDIKTNVLEDDCSNVSGFIVDEEIQNSVFHMDKTTYDQNTVAQNISALKSEWNTYLGEASMIDNLGACGDVYLLILASSYKDSNGETAIQNGWVEPWGTYADGAYTKDELSQAVIYEALFEALYENNYAIDGVISYGYWWSNSMWPQNFWQRSDISHSIRLKKAEQVFFKWTQVFNQ